MTIRTPEALAQIYIPIFLHNAVFSIRFENKKDWRHLEEYRYGRNKRRQISLTINLLGTISQIIPALCSNQEPYQKQFLLPANSPRLEMIVPFYVRAGVWFKHTLPYVVNPLVGALFRRQLNRTLNQ